MLLVSLLQVPVGVLMHSRHRMRTRSANLLSRHRRRSIIALQQQNDSVLRQCAGFFGKEHDQTYRSIQATTRIDDSGYLLPASGRLR